jgi:plastocyanin
MSQKRMSLKIIRRDVLLGASALAGALSIASREGFAASPKVHDINISSFEFVPQHIVVKVGDTIRWTNEDIAPHTATAMEGSWDTGEIVKGEARSVVVAEGMETSYFCAFHPHMTGTIELA